MWPKWNLAVSFSSPVYVDWKLCVRCGWEGVWSPLLPPLIVNCLAFLMVHYSLWGHGEGVTERGKLREIYSTPPHPLRALFTTSRASCISWRRQQQKQQQQQQQRWRKPQKNNAALQWSKHSNCAWNLSIDKNKSVKSGKRWCLSANKKD